MKKLITPFLLFISTALFAQTTISTATVSGTWTTAGSPYIVTIPTSVLAGQILTIQPGVEVRFQATTGIIVIGQLIANGTAVLPIVFKSDDTTGWSNHTVTTGGWSGISYQAYGGGGTDNSILNYCTFQDVKYGYTAALMYKSALTAERGLKILNCIFTHNHGGVGMYQTDAIAFLTTYQISDTIIVDNCTFTNNACTFGILRSVNYFGGYSFIRNSNLYSNHLGSTFLGIWNNLLFENNSVHDNDMNADNSPIKVGVGFATIRGNKVYNNVCDQLAAVGCRAGRITIENNLICNNRQLDGSCGVTGGGGGIHLAHNDFSDFNDTYYIVRNNVIANNSSANGGGGIYVYHCRATISNNQIVNNSSTTFGKGIMVLDVASEVNLRSNLFYSKSNLGVVDTTNIIYMFSPATLKCDYNYLPSAFSSSVQNSFGYTLLGDTLNNVIGTSPNMIAPTSDNDVTTSALFANFDIMSTSPCINQGDTVGSFSSLFDYSGNTRFVGSAIDIGAFEYDPLQSVFDNQMNSTNTMLYPNPAIENLIIHFENEINDGKISVLDLTGKVIFQTSISNALSLNLITREYAEGIYFLKLESLDGSTIKKFVVIK